MTPALEPLPSDLASAHAMILAERAARMEAQAVAARAVAVNSSTEALIAHLKLQIEKLRREIYGSRSERKARLLEQMELQLEDLEASATEDELAAERVAARTQTDRFTPFPDDGRVCLTNNAAVHALRGFAIGRKSWLFAGSDRGADRAAVMVTLITTARLNDVDPLAWLADMLARIADIPQKRLRELLS